MINSPHLDASNYKRQAAIYLDFARFARSHPQFQHEVPLHVKAARDANRASIRASKRTHCQRCLTVCIEPGDAYCMHCGSPVIR